MDSAALEEYAYDRLYALKDNGAVLGDFTLVAAEISLRWKAIGHPVAAAGWGEAAVQLEKAADSIEQAIKEVSDE